MSAFVEVQHIVKTYRSGSQEIHANDDVSFQIEEGEFCVIVGPSGAGKTTMLNLLGGMERPTDGHLWVDGVDITRLKEKDITRFRRYDVGFVFQFYNLMPNLTAIENIEVAVEICKNPLSPHDVLTAVGLAERRQNFPSQLSGGEQQRVSIARAIAKNPKILLCDEPTGALDYETGKKILQLLQDTCRKQKKTVIVITHNQALTAMADRVISFKNGKVKDVVLNPHPTPIERIEW